MLGNALDKQRDVLRDRKDDLGEFALLEGKVVLVDVVESLVRAMGGGASPARAVSLFFTLASCTASSADLAMVCKR